MSADFSKAKPGTRKISLDSSQDSIPLIEAKISLTFKLSPKSYLHHMIVLVDDDIPHFLIILQENNTISLFQSYSAKLTNDPNNFCSYSLSDYLTKSVEELYKNIIFNESTGERTPLLPEIKERNLLDMMRDYVTYKNVPLSFITQDLKSLFSGKETMFNSYQRLFACPLPVFFKEDYFSSKIIKTPKVWIGIQSVEIIDSDFLFFKESLKKDECPAEKKDTN